MMRMSAPFFMMVALVGCTVAPTTTHTQAPTFTKNKQLVDEKVVIVDARAPFQYAVAHVPGSIPLQWTDFSQKDRQLRGLLDQDLFFHARRLARRGIGPDTKIVVLGNGVKGNGEEGRVAWTLRVLGLRDVSFANANSYQLAGVNGEEPPPRAEVSIWKPVVNEALTVDRAQFEKILYQPRMNLDAPVIIDVRTVDEYTGKTGRQLKVDYGALNVPWTEFLTPEGAPNPAIAQKLESVGVTKARKIVLIDWQGVRSALATLVLRDLGFNATNFAGGYDQLE